MKCILILFSIFKCMNIALQSITIPTYLYNDDACRELILQQLLRIIETVSLGVPECESDSYSIFQLHKNSSVDGKYNTRGVTRYLSFNMYRFNIEIRKNKTLHPESRMSIKNDNSHKKV